MIGVCAVPVWMISSAMREAVSIGMANPTPMDPDSPPRAPSRVAMALLTPITSPSAFRSGPPELPGLIAASVWIALMNEVSDCSPAVTGRSRAETIPAVTVPDKPSGEPTAIAVSPTWTVPALPSSRHRQAGLVHLDDGQVVVGVRTHQRRRSARPVRERHLQRVRTGHDVGVRQDVAVRAHDEPAAGRGPRPRVGVDVDDRRGDRGGDGRDASLRGRRRLRPEVVGAAIVPSEFFDAA